MSSSLDCGCEDKTMNRENLGETDSRSAAHQTFTVFWSPSFSGFCLWPVRQVFFFKTSSYIIVLY